MCSPHDPPSSPIIGRSPAIREMLAQIAIVAPTPTTVVVYGETGTGKELVARAIHALSARASGPLQTVNCAAVPAPLLESELFGHERGAFSGAVQRRTGRFEAAHGGTFFLDEIGEMPPEVQPKVLRLLQERAFERLGSSETQVADVRVVAATHRDLVQMVEEGEFREDLYYRLNVFPIHVPPLRERAEDIPLLVDHFLAKFSERMGRVVHTPSSAALDALMRYTWPGNIRELQNTIERGVLLSRGDRLESVELGMAPTRPSASAPVVTLRDVSRRHILEVLESTGWVVAGRQGAAAKLGMKRSTLNFRMKKLGISRPTRLPLDG